jgi:sodium ion-translocating decarboxylase beta subunit
MGFEQLMPAIAGMRWQDLVMIAIGLILIYLAIAKNYEPTLLLPMGFGAILVNIPLSSAITQLDPATGEAVEGVLNVFFNAGIATEIFPLLIFIAIGAMIDFSPLFRSPSLLLFGAAAQFGIFMTMVLASCLGYDLREAASIGIIGAADGPTSIVVASRFAPNLLGPISVAAYSYMALVPIIQPPVIRLLTTRKERLIRMTGTGHANKKISKKALIAFPIVVTIVAGIIAPSSLALIGFLMFGNLIRECGVLNKLSLSAQNELASLVTILLGITIASTMKGGWITGTSAI